MPGRKDSRSDRPLYMISVAAELAGMHPQTLRIYERRQLVMPSRSAGNTRLYSDSDIERLRLIQRLTTEGVNLSGVIRVIELENELVEARRQLDAMRDARARAERRLAEEILRVRRAASAEIVLVRRGRLATRER